MSVDQRVLTKCFHSFRNFRYLGRIFRLLQGRSEIDGHEEGDAMDTEEEDPEEDPVEDSDEED